MTATKPPPPPPPTTVAAKPSGRRLTNATPQAICPKLLVYAVEGWGKTTLGSHAPSPVVLMARGEAGYSTLLSAGLVPACPAPSVETWDDLLAWLDQLIVDQQGTKTLVLDALGGFERLCHEKVCTRDFKGEWGETGFASFQKGYDVSIGEWLKMLQRLEQINNKGVAIVLLGHSKVKNFKNPTGPDFERYICDVHEKTWAVTAKWSDAVLFGRFLTIVDVAKTTGNVAKDKGKGIGGTTRVMETERRDAWDAKNRYGMPERIDIPDDHTAAWATVWNHIVK